jgi:hypothetical protein
MARALLVLFATVLALLLPHVAAAQNCQGQTIVVAANAMPMCSKDFYVSGSCSSSDVTAAWLDPNAASGAGWNGEGPWESSSISIIGATIVFFSGGPFQYAFLGNSASPDPMLWYDKSDVGATRAMWGPYAFAFPPKGTAGEPHIDLHVGCVSGSFQAFVTINYTVP